MAEVAGEPGDLCAVLQGPLCECVAEAVERSASPESGRRAGCLPRPSPGRACDEEDVARGICVVRVWKTSFPSALSIRRHRRRSSSTTSVMRSTSRRSRFFGVPRRLRCSSANANDGLLEVNISPSQRDELPLPHARLQGDRQSVRYGSAWRCEKSRGSSRSRSRQPPSVRVEVLRRGSSRTGFESAYRYVTAAWRQAPDTAQVLRAGGRRASMATQDLVEASDIFRPDPSYVSGSERADCVLTMVEPYEATVEDLRSRFASQLSAHSENPTSRARRCRPRRPWSASRAAHRAAPSSASTRKHPTSQLFAVRHRKCSDLSRRQTASRCGQGRTDPSAPPWRLNEDCSEIQTCPNHSHFNGDF